MKGKCYCCQGCDCCCEDQPNREERKKERETKCKVYLKLLQKLVKTKQHYDYENRIQDDIGDLRQDMQNFVKKETDELKNLMNKILNKMK